MNGQTLKRLGLVLIPGILLAISTQVYAGIGFHFQEAGGTVTMTSHGTLDTSLLVSVTRSDGWGGTGTEHNGTVGDIDIMGGTSSGDIDTQFGFSPGTDVSAITNPGGPFAASNFSVGTIQGSKSFTTYSGFEQSLRIAGIGIRAIDMDGPLWTPDQEWTYAAGATFASLNLVPGTYAIVDAVTGEAIVIQVGGTLSIPSATAVYDAVPVPALNIWTLIVLGASVLLMGGMILRRRSAT